MTVPNVAITLIKFQGINPVLLRFLRLWRRLSIIIEMPAIAALITAARANILSNMLAKESIFSIWQAHSIIQVQFP